MMDLNALRDFLAVAEHGSYAEAGRVLGLPKSTLSRRVAALEGSLGVRLMDRDARRLRLTAEGDRLRERASAHVATLSGLGDETRADDAPLRGRLRLSVPILFGHSGLGRVAARFAEAHPGVLLEAVVGDRQVDLLREGFDAALRVNPAPDSALSGRLLGRNRLSLVAAPALAKRLGYEGVAPERVTWPAVVRRGWGDDGGWDVVAEGARVRVPADVRLDLSSPLAMRDAVLAGTGAALLPVTSIRQELADGRLIRLGERIGDPEEVWIVHASGRLPSRRLRALVDVLVTFFRDAPLDA